MQYEKGKLCESRGRKVTDLTGKRPKMAGLPDNITRLSRMRNLTRIELNIFDVYPCSSDLLTIKRNRV